MIYIIVYLIIFLLLLIYLIRNIIKKRKIGINLYLNALTTLIVLRIAITYGKSSGSINDLGIFYISFYATIAFALLFIVSVVLRLIRKK